MMNKWRKAVAIALCICCAMGNMTYTGFVSHAVEDLGQSEVENAEVQDDVTEVETEESETPDVTEQQGDTENDSQVTDSQVENSWRYNNGETIPSISARATVSPNAWKKVNGRYVNLYGDVIPGAVKKGVDVSEHNGTIDWEKAKADGVEYAIIRCGYGMDQVSQDDQQWLRNVSECERLGIPYGVYIYSYATNVQRAASEAAHTIRLLQGHNPTYPVYFDMEDDSTKYIGKDLLGSIASTYCNAISAAGYRPGIYANLDWRNNVLPESTGTNPSWSQWVAQYNYKCTYTKSYAMWQCTSSGKVDGITGNYGNVDVNFWMVQTSDVEPATVQDRNIISYRTHQQDFGWGATVSNGYQSGATGYAMRIEAMELNIGEGYGDLGVEYSAHVAGIGWQDFVNNGATAGTVGQSRAIEAIKIQLTGAEAEKYDIYYRVHAANQGWLGWAKNGSAAGTQGYGYQVEAIQIVVVEKNGASPGSTSNSFILHPTDVNYQTYINGADWQNAVSNGSASGTQNQSKAIGALKLNVSNATVSGGINYSTYLENYGWLEEVSNAQTSGKPGTNLRIEAVKISLTDELADNYDVYYRTYVQNYGWLGWTKNGGESGTEGWALRVEAIQVQLVTKDAAAPGSTDNAYVPAPLVSYSTHVQNEGWLANVTDGQTSGTSGESKRIEAMKISMVNSSDNQYLQYRTHVENYGWQSWKSGGDIAGTSGESKRVEAFQIKLSGSLAEKYDVYYRAYVQNYGWLGWASNGEYAGTAGRGLRVESIQVKLVEKNGDAPASSDISYLSDPIIKYSTHVENIGWMDYVTNGEISGTMDQCKRIEALKIAFADTSNNQYIQYRAHVQNDGWQDWKTGGGMAGTSGRALRVEALQIKLTSNMAEKYDIYYRTFVENYGWLDWAKNGESAGSQGASLRIESLQVVLVEKGGSAPGSVTKAFIQK